MPREQSRKISKEMLTDIKHAQHSTNCSNTLLELIVQLARMHAKLLQLCTTQCDPMDSSPPGSSVHRILQARILEWVAVSFSKSRLRTFLF